MLKKLTSRKFWAAVVGVITGLTMIFGLDDGVVMEVAGTVTAVGSIITYIISEAIVDRAAASANAIYMIENDEKDQTA